MWNLYSLYGYRASTVWNVRSAKLPPPPNYRHPFPSLYCSVTFAIFKSNLEWINYLYFILKSKEILSGWGTITCNSSVPQTMCVKWGLKGLSCVKDFGFLLTWIDLGLKKGHGWFLKFLGAFSFITNYKWEYYLTIDKTPGFSQRELDFVFVIFHT
jgi:hypothetical protein